METHIPLETETLRKRQQRFRLPMLQKTRMRNGVECYEFPFLDDSNKIDYELLTLLYRHRPYARRERISKADFWEDFHKTCHAHVVGGYKVLQGIGLGTIRKKRLPGYVEVMTKIWQLEKQQQQNGGEAGETSHIPRGKVRKILEAVVKDIVKAQNQKKGDVETPPHAAASVNIRRDGIGTGGQQADDGSVSDATNLSELSALLHGSSKKKRHRRDGDDNNNDDDPEARARRAELAIKMQEMRLLRMQKKHEMHVKELEIREKELAIKEKELELDRCREVNRAAQAQRNDELMMAMIERFKKNGDDVNDNEPRQTE